MIGFVGVDTIRVGFHFADAYLGDPRWRHRLTDQDTDKAGVPRHFLTLPISPTHSARLSVTEYPGKWWASIAYEVPRLLPDNPLGLCPLDLAKDLTVLLVNVIIREGLVVPRCKHPDDQECPGPSCWLSQVFVQRLDVSMDVRVRDTRQYVTLAERHRQRWVREKRTHEGSSIMLTRGRHGLKLRIYGKHLQTPQSGFKGVMRIEAELNKVVLQRLGLRRLEDLSGVVLAEEFRRDVEWAGLGQTIGLNKPVARLIDELEGATAVEKSRLLHHLRQAERDPRHLAGLSPATRRKYLLMAAQIGVRFGDDLAPPPRIRRRIDFDGGVEIPVYGRRLVQRRFTKRTSQA